MSFDIFVGRLVIAPSYSSIIFFFSLFVCLIQLYVSFFFLIFWAPLVHATRVAFDKWVHHTRRLFALLCQLLSFAPCFSSEAPCFCGDYLLICFGLVSPDCRRFLGLFVGGVDVANSGLSHLLGVGKCSLPRSYHPDRPALRYTNTNRNTRTGHFTAASKRPG